MAPALAQAQRTIPAPISRPRKKRATAVDAHIALRLRAAPQLARMTQTDAATRIGVTFQQLQKYEKGLNRISCGTIAKLAIVYGKPVAWFFDGAVVQPDARQDIGTALIAAPHGVELAHHFLAIDNLASRKALIEIAMALSKVEVRDV